GRQRLYPIVDDEKKLLGVATRNDLQTLVDAHHHDPDHHDPRHLDAVVRANPIVAYPDESLRMVVYRMAETGLTRFPVVDRRTRQLIGMIALTDLLKARALNLDAEQRRERVIRPRIALPFRKRSA